MRKLSAASLGSALLATALLATLAACSEKPPSEYQGYVEGEYVNLGSPYAGRLDKLYVARGQNVTAGSTLFTLEADEEVAASQQAEQQLKAAQAQLADMKLGKRPPERGMVDQQLAQARASEDLARRQAMRDQAQFEAGGIPRSQWDDARANLEIASARVRELQAQTRVSQLPARQDQIRAQEAQVAAAQAIAQQQAWRLAQKQVQAKAAGLVADTLYRQGEWVPAGSPVVRLLPPANVKVRFFVPESIAGALKPGRKLALHCDGCPSEIAASVSFIANDPEFTPPVIYSKDSREKLVFMVEARPAAPDATRLRPGQPVWVALK